MAFFYEEGEEKKRSGVFMRHVNIGYIAENEDGSGSYAPSRIFIDPTLTQEGEAAEAKATGDAIKALAEQTNAALDELSETTETAINDLSGATEEAINSLAAIGVIEDTKSGEVVSISDSAAYKMQGLRLYGKSRQATTTGAQLLDVREGVSSSPTGVTVTADGTGGLTLNGTFSEEETASIYLVGSWSGQEVLFEEDTYTFSVDGLSSDEKVYIVNNQSVVTSSAGSCTATSPITGLAIQLKTGKTYSNLKIYPMLSASSSAKPWEPYTGGQPSPSPEYPQEIESAGDGGDIGVKIQGKNLIYTASVTSNNGVTMTANEDGTFTLNGTVANSNARLYFVGRYNARNVIYPDAKYSFKVDGLQQSDRVVIRDSSHDESTGAYNTVLSYNGNIAQVSIGLVVGHTYDNTIIKPMLIAGDNMPDEFIPGVEPQTLTYPTPNGLPGIPVESGGNYTDAEGQQWICDEVDFGRGKYVQRIKKEFLTGTPNFNVTTDIDAERFRWGSCLTNIYKDGPNLSLSNFATFQRWSTGTSNHPIFAVSEKDVYFKPTASTTKEEINALFTQMIASENPPYIVGQLETPIETDLTPEQLAAYAALTTYKPNTTITTDSDPTAGIGVDYIADTKAYIDNKFAQLAELSTVVNALIGADE